MSLFKKDNIILVFSCTHNPFMRKGYVEFLKGVYKDFGCNQVINLGDEVDHHRISFHPPEPKAMGAKEELIAARKALKTLYRAFPVVKCCLSNHTSRHTRRGADVGIPEDYFKSLNELLEAPKGWVWKQEWVVEGVTYTHGEGFSGDVPHRAAAMRRMSSVVIGHLHSVGGVEYIATATKRVFGMCIGCGIDHNAYAFEYAKDAAKKPMIGCGVVIGGREAIFVPMELGDKE